MQFLVNILNILYYITYIIHALTGEPPLLPQRKRNAAANSKTNRKTTTNKLPETLQSYRKSFLTFSGYIE